MYTMGRAVLAPTTLLVCLGFALASYAQSPDNLPDAPQTQAGMQRAAPIQPHGVSSQPSASNRGFVLVSTLSFGTMIADIESTRHAIESCGLQEVNPLYGRNPSRGKLYAINLPITGAQNLLAWYVHKRKPDSKLWLLMPLTNTAVHTAGFVNNFSKCH
jgi:hypothetical protein